MNRVLVFEKKKMRKFSLMLTKKYFLCFFVFEMFKKKHYIIFWLPLRARSRIFTQFENSKDPSQFFNLI